MADSRRNSSGNLRAALAVVPLLLGAGAAQAARAPCANQEIVVDAKPMEVEMRTNNAVLRDVVITQCDVRIEAAEARFNGGLNFDNGRWVISGDVRISAEGGSLRSDKAVVSFKNKLISAATITGAPATFEQAREDGTTSRGRAGTIEYEATSGTVSLSENAWLLYGRNEISGQKLAYNLRTQTFQPQARATTEPSGTGRIRIVIQPEKKEDKKEEKKP